MTATAKKEVKPMKTESREGLDNVRTMIREAYGCELGAGIYKTSSLNDLISIKPKEHPKPSKAKFNKLTDAQLEKLSPKEKIKYQEDFDSFRSRQNNPISVKESRPAGRSMPLEYRGGYQWLLKRINTAPTEYKLIIWHIYKPDSQSKYAADLLDALWAGYESEVRGKWQKTKDTAKCMMRIQVSALNDPFKFEAIHQRPWFWLNVPGKEWHDTLKDCWSGIRAYIEAVDKRALNHVSG